VGFPIDSATAYSRHEPRPPEPAGPWTGLARWIAVVGGVGYVPVAPGTAGSLAAVLVFLAPWLVAPVARSGPGAASGWVPWSGCGFGLLLGGVIAVGIWAAGRAERSFGRADDGRIVVDEVAGQLIALAPLVYGPGLALGSGRAAAESAVPAAGRALPMDLFLAVVTGFVLFRVFDVWKPGPVRWAERRFSGGFGVMADDMVAGIAAALGLGALMLGARAVSGSPGGLGGLGGSIVGRIAEALA